MDKDISDPEQITRISNVAAHLFAELGYDNTTGEMIAEAAGVNREVVTAAGGRAALYRHALERFYRDERDMLDRVSTAPGAGKSRFSAALDHILDFYLDRREMIAIWQQRGLADASDMDDVEERYQVPSNERAAAILGPEVATGPRFQMIRNVFSWCLVSFIYRGLSPVDGPVLDPADPRARELFHEYMIELYERLEVA
ncbi:TetR family transcriptional regulator [Actinomadura sp. LD22]|uniref:TetR family transcriptional regulator n=1 Tax=Actinomadura physcomitrii TaxID=2650748 RepID=A0A6I4M7K2_9ACTN|nr:TetR/AcrR family transcriptional regulator [Actinomadura physcomitrii]MWA01612.1 TetR family transcriptional regulator [Actinomadura physcomitrii]